MVRFGAGGVLVGSSGVKLFSSQCFRLLSRRTKASLAEPYRLGGMYCHGCVDKAGPLLLLVFCAPVP